MAFFSRLTAEAYGGVTRVTPQYGCLMPSLYCADVALLLSSGRRPADAMIIILFKVVIALGTGLLGAGVLRTRVMELPESSFLGWAVGLQLVPALALFLALYVLGHQEPTSDVPAYYLPAAHAALQGQVPFRDFTTSYAPLFPYVGAALVSIWDSGKMFALFDIALNAAGLLLWHQTAKGCLDRPVTRQTTVLYATSGHAVVQALLGTNQAWISFGLGASALLMATERHFAAGLAQAATACVTKVLTHLFWPVLWIFTPRRFSFLLGAVVPTLAVYAGFALLSTGEGLLYPLSHEGGLISSGNLPYLLDPILSANSRTERLVVDTLTLAALATTVGWLYLRTRTLQPDRRPRVLLAGLALTALVFMIFSKKSFTGYLIFVMYPVVATAVTGLGNRLAKAGFLIGFNALLVAEPSLWFRLDGFDRGGLRAWFATGGGTAAMGLVAVDLALIGCYVYLAWMSVRWVERTADGAIAARNVSQSATACSLV